MSELFVEAGQSKDVAVSAPSLQAAFVPAIDKSTFTDGFGLVTPFGGGGTLRNYGDYGITQQLSAEGTQLKDLSSISLVGGSNFSYGSEGVPGPQGPAGPSGPPGLSASNLIGGGVSGLFDLDRTLKQIQVLGTAADKAIYVSEIETIYEAADWSASTTPETPGSWGHISVSRNNGYIFIEDNNNNFYYSDDGGDTWNSVNAPTEDAISGVAISGDGSILVVYPSESDVIYISDDFGSNWSSPKPAGEGQTRRWNKVVMSDDGSVMIAVGNDAGAEVYISSNGGDNWSAVEPNGGSDNWIDADCSSDGTKMIVCGSNSLGYVCTSSDTGQNWSTHHPDGGTETEWYCVAISDDGNTMWAGQGMTTTHGRVYKSVNGGTSWTEVRPKGDVDTSWYETKISDDAGVVMLGEYYGKVYTSVDGGDTWTNPYNGWSAIDLSKDGLTNIVSVLDVLYIGESDNYVLDTWAETDLTSFARTIIDDSSAEAVRNTLELGTTDSVEFADLTLNTPSNIYALSHDSFANFVANEHINHTSVSIIAGTGLSGGGDISSSRTLNCTITQYTDEMAQDSVGGILDDGTVGNIVFTYDDEGGVISGATQDGEIDHNALNNTHNLTTDIDHNSLTNAHNLTTDIDHDQLTNFASNEHFVQTAITNVSSALSTGLLKVTNGTGLLSVVSDNSSNWDTAYSHSQLTSGNPHQVSKSDVGLGSVENTALSTWAGSSNITTLGTISTVGNITIADDGTIGNNALLTFNDTDSQIIFTGEAFDIGADCSGLYNASVATLRHYGQSARFYYDAGFSSYEFYNNGTTSAPNFFVLNRGRGDFDTPVIVNDNDKLGSFTARGWDGVDEYSDSSAIYFEVDGTPGENIMPGRIVFATSQAGTENLTTAVTIDSSQNMTVVGNVTGANLNISNWDDAYTHSQLTSGNPHNVSKGDLSLDTDDSPTFIALTLTSVPLKVGPNSGSYGLIDVGHNSVSTTTTLGGIYVDISKTAGVTNYADNMYAIYGSLNLNQSGGEFGDSRGVNGEAVLTNGSVKNGRSITGLWGRANLDGGSIESGDAWGCYAILDQEAGNSAGNDVGGIKVYVDADGTVSGNVYGILIYDLSNVDYAIYQNGSAPSHFGGNINAAGGFSDNGSTGIDTTFLDQDGNTITVSGGIITAKTAP